MEFSSGGERFAATNVPFGALVLVAYDITVRQLSGPAEFLSEKYDVATKAEPSAKPAEMLDMLQSLLAERFKLVLRREMKNVPVYALIIGKVGPKLRTSKVSDDGRVVLRTPSVRAGTEPRSGQLIFKNESILDFAWALSRTAGIGDRVVVDHTGLKGRYDFELTFEPERPPGIAPFPVEPALPERPSIFSAIQEQLGLKLEPRRAVEFLTIEHVERPNEN